MISAQWSNQGVKHIFYQQIRRRSQNKKNLYKTWTEDVLFCKARKLKKFIILVSFCGGLALILGIQRRVNPVRRKNRFPRASSSLEHRIYSVQWSTAGRRLSLCRCNNGPGIEGGAVGAFCRILVHYFYQSSRDIASRRNNAFRHVVIVRSRRSRNVPPTLDPMNMGFLCPLWILSRVACASSTHAFFLSQPDRFIRSFSSRSFEIYPRCTRNKRRINGERAAKLDRFNRLPVFDEYTRRREETSIFCVVEKVATICCLNWNLVIAENCDVKQSFLYELILCYNSHVYSVLDEYTRHRLHFATYFRYALLQILKEVATGNWLIESSFIYVYFHLYFYDRKKKNWAYRSVPASVFIHF